MILRHDELRIPANLVFSGNTHLVKGFSNRVSVIDTDNVKQIQGLILDYGAFQVMCDGQTSDGDRVHTLITDTKIICAIVSDANKLKCVLILFSDGSKSIRKPKK